MSDLAIAHEIMRQLGGPRFCAMTGARDLMGFSLDEGPIRGGVQFKVGSNPGGVSAITIRLTVMDEYEVTFYTGSLLTMRTLSTHTGIYCDTLVRLIEETTGLDTVLATQAITAHGREVTP